MNNNQNVIDMLNEYVEWLYDNPDLPKVDKPLLSTYYWSDDPKEEMAVLARAGARSLMKVTKDYSSTFFRLKVEGERFKFEAVAPRENVCTRTQVGTKTVTKKELPEGVEYVEVEIEEPVYDWECSPLLS